MFALSRKWLQRRDGSSRTELESQSIQSISNSTWFHLRIWSSFLTDATGHSRPKGSRRQILPKLRPDGFHSGQDTARQQQLGHAEANQRRETAADSPPPLRHSQLLRLSSASLGRQTGDFWFTFSTVVSHPAPRRPAHKTPRCRLALKGLNLVSHGRECTR